MATNSESILSDLNNSSVELSLDDYEINPDLLKTTPDTSNSIGLSLDDYEINPDLLKVNNKISLKDFLTPEQYEEEANSWSNRLGSSVDSVYSMFNEGLGLLADQLGADETAASFRADAAQNLKDRAARPQPKITASVTESVDKISKDIADANYLDAAGKVATTVKATFAEAIPSLAPAVGGLAAARALSPFLAAIPVVGAPLALLTNIILTFGSGYLMMSGEGYKRAKELGADETESKTAGVVSGIGGGILDRFFAGAALKGLTQTLGRKEVTNRIAEQTSKEAAEEIMDKGLKAASIDVLKVV